MDAKQVIALKGEKEGRGGTQCPVVAVTGDEVLESNMALNFPDGLARSTEGESNSATCPWSSTSTLSKSRMVSRR